ncbi:MAG: hemerythrin domain-containing protein [Magnetococcales bacterium]|nr:hemerythrin domain-containing protein [Magnetococcales bacterium]
MQSPKKPEINLYGPATERVSFLWTESLRTGHDTIDRQHQALYEAFHGITQLLEVPDVNLKYWFGLVLRKTEDYVLTHFADEEKLMTDLSYPNVHVHQLQHQEIVEALKKHQTVITQLKTDAEKRAEARALLRFLEDWLNDHVLVSDKDLVNFICQTAKGRELLS